MAHVAHSPLIHKALIWIVAVLILLLGVTGPILAIFQVLHLLLPSIVGVIDLSWSFLRHFTALLPLSDILHV